MMVNLSETPTAAALNQQAAVYLKAGQFDKAQAICQQALNLDPNCATTCKMAGNILQAIGQLEAAKRW
jgi:tetratricopeptide (TPR) repeat protein